MPLIHSPGPWSAHCTDEEQIHGKTYRQWVVRAEGRGAIATVYYTTPDGEGDAKLMAASLELAEAGSDALDILCNIADDAEAQAVARRLRAALNAAGVR